MGNFFDDIKSPGIGKFLINSASLHFEDRGNGTFHKISPKRYNKPKKWLKNKHNIYKVEKF